MPRTRKSAGAIANSDASEATNGGVIDTRAQGSTGNAHASARGARAGGAGSRINTAAVSGVSVLPGTATTQALRHVSTTSVAASLGSMHASAIGGSASSGGQSTTIAMTAHTINVHNHHPNSSDSKEGKTIAPAALTTEERNGVITKLKNYYKSKSKLSGLLSGHEQPITDINVSIIDASLSRAQSQERKESKTPKREETALAHFERMHVVNCPVPVSEMFDKAPGEDGKLETNSAKHLLISGAPGVGKTTMSQYMAYQWSIDKLWKNKFDYLFWIPLRNLLQYPTDPNVALSLAYVIHQECFDDDPTISAASIGQVIKSESSRILLVLDGYDEVAHLFENRQHPITRMLYQALRFEYCMLTSRPYQLPSLDKFQYDRHLENTGFTDSNIESYVTRYFAGFTPPQPEKGQALLAYLKTNLSVWGTAHIPINLALICEIWATEAAVRVAREGKEEAKSVTTSFNSELSVTGLYQKMTLFLLERYLKREGKPTEDLYPTDIYKECKAELEFLSELAFEGLRTYEIILTAELQRTIVEKMRRNGSPPAFSKILASGFLRAAESPLKKEIERPHYFIHLTFQEYLAAHYLVSCLEKTSASEEYAKVTKWLCTEKYNPRYQVVLGFMAGLLSLDKNKDTNAALQQFWKVLLSEPFDLTRIGHIRLMVRCLEETRGDNRIPHHTRLLDELGQWLLAVSRNEDVSFQREAILPLRVAPWVLKQPNMLENVLACYEKASKKIKRRILIFFGALGGVVATPKVRTILLTGLASKDTQIRQEAAETLNELGSAVVTPEILKGLENALYDREDDIVLSTVVKIVGKLGTTAATPEIMQALLVTLHDKDIPDDGGTATEAAEVLGKIGPAAVTSEILDALLKAFCGKNDDASVNAAHALCGLGSAAATPRVLEVLLKSLRNKDIRAMAVQTLGKLGPAAATDEVLTALSNVLQSKDKQLAVEAAIALENLGFPNVRSKVLMALLTVFRTGDSKDKERAASALGDIGPAAAADEILTELEGALDDKDKWVGVQAASALGSLGARKPHVLERLRSTFHNKSRHMLVRINTAQTLAKLGAAVDTQEILEVLMAAIVDDSFQVKRDAIEALGKLDPAAISSKVLKSVWAALGDKNEVVIARAVKALGRFGAISEKTEVFSALLEVLHRNQGNSFLNPYITRTFEQLNLSQHLCHLQLEHLKMAVTQKVYFRATPLRAFIQQWLDSRLKPSRALSKANTDQHKIWLELVGTLAFYRAVPITVSTTEIHVQEGGTVTPITLEPEYAAQLRKGLIEEFAKQARQLGLPNEFYTVLKGNVVPYPFEPISGTPNTSGTASNRACGNAPRAVAAATAATEDRAHRGVAAETKALRPNLVVASATDRASSSPAKAANLISKQGFLNSTRPATRSSVRSVASTMVAAYPDAKEAEATQVAPSSRKRRSTHTSGNDSVAQTQSTESSSSVTKKTKR